MATVDHVESGTIAGGSLGTSETVTLSTTLSDVNKTFLFFTGGGAAGARPGRDMWTGEITNTTTLTFERYNTTACNDIAWFVVEFSAGVTVQHTETTIPNTGDAHQPLGDSISLTADTVESGLISWSQRASDSVWIGFNTRIRYADQDYVEIAVNEDDAEHVIHCQVIVYDDTADGRNVPGEMFNVSTSGTDGTITVRDTIDTGKTVCIGSAAIKSAGTAVDAIDALFRFAIDDSTTVSWHRGDGQSTTMSAWGWYQLFEFLDGASVQQFTITLSTSQTSNTATISSVSTSNSIIIPSSCVGWGECSDTRASDLSQGICTLALTNATTVTASRDAHDSTSCTVTGYVVDFTSSS